MTQVSIRILKHVSETGKKLFYESLAAGFLLTYSMIQNNIIWKADCHSAYQKISCFLYGTRRFVSVFTKALPPDIL